MWPGPWFSLSVYLWSIFSDIVVDNGLYCTDLLSMLEKYLSPGNGHFICDNTRLTVNMIWNFKSEFILGLYLFNKSSPMPHSEAAVQMAKDNCWGQKLLPGPLNSL